MKDRLRLVSARNLFGAVDSCSTHVSGSPSYTLRHKSANPTRKHALAPLNESIPSLSVVLVHVVEAHAAKLLIIDSTTSTELQSGDGRSPGPLDSMAVIGGAARHICLQIVLSAASSGEAASIPRVSLVPAKKEGDQMRGTVAVVREQGQVFSVVAVQDSALNPDQRDDILRAAQVHFGPRTAIMGERRHQTYGPDDVVRWLRGVHPAQLPWRDFTLS